MTEEEYPTFKRLFWQWFDALPLQEKQKFWYYHQDIAETNFFFSVYNKNT